MRWEVIPQVFYDLIARVIPGTVILVVGCAVFAGPGGMVRSISALPKGEGIGLISVFLWLCLSYVVGYLLCKLWDILCKLWHILDEIWQPLAKIFKRMFFPPTNDGDKEPQEKHQDDVNQSLKREKMPKWIKEHSKVAELLGEPEIALKLNNKEVPDTHVLHDHLRIYAPAEAFRLLKLVAEKRLFQALSMGLGILLVINLYRWVQTSANFLSERALLSYAIIVAILCCRRGMARSREYYDISTRRTWLFYNYPLGAAKEVK